MTEWGGDFRPAVVITTFCCPVKPLHLFRASHSSGTGRHIIRLGCQPPFTDAMSIPHSNLWKGVAYSPYRALMYRVRSLYYGTRKVIPSASVLPCRSKKSSLTLLAFGARKPYLCSRGNGYPTRIAVFCALRRPTLPPYGKIWAVFPGNFPRARKNLLRANSDLP